ncbi:hypothetical protein EV179_001014 [Coemansia sp. RSA 487]|nr:hypothetical protein EV179_001014 [Coemansia sp. RSA 487]
MLSNICKYGDMCCFAHGPDELRQRPNPPKYKTAVCRNIVQFGQCSYGAKCDFIHNYKNDEPERKISTAIPAPIALSAALPIEHAAHEPKPNPSIYTARPGFRLSCIGNVNSNTADFYGSASTSIGFHGRINSPGFGFEPTTPNYAYTKTNNSFVQMLSQDRIVGSSHPFSTSSSHDVYPFAARESGFYGILASMDEISRL